MRLSRDRVSRRRCSAAPPHGSRTRRESPLRGGEASQVRKRSESSRGSPSRSLRLQSAGRAERVNSHVREPIPAAASPALPRVLISVSPPSTHDTRDPRPANGDPHSGRRLPQSLGSRTAAVSTHASPLASPPDLALIASLLRPARLERDMALPRTRSRSVTPTHRWPPRHPAKPAELGDNCPAQTTS